MDNYLEINRKLWNDKVEHHVKSDFYDVDAFIEGKQVLNDIELEKLGDVRGKSILHLQCHFGQDSIALSRMGAEVTGLDLSDEAIEKAQWLADTCGTKTKFVCCDVYSASDYIQGKFDIVFTSYGTVGWLPDMDKWASIVQQFIKPGGKFVFAEFHPVVWMMDYQFKKFDYSYFNVSPIIEELEGTYADKNAQIKNKEITWNHSLSEVIGALLKQGLVLESLDEYDYSPYPCFENLVEVEDGKFQIKGLEGILPMAYALSMLKPN